jgi:peptide/nickel transport system permease protein
MRFFLIRRLLLLIPILVGISLVVFIIMRLLPGDVARMVLMGGEDAAGQQVDPAAVEALREQLGLNQPIYVQYAAWVWQLLHFDLGTSLWSGKPVIEDIAARVPLTVELALLGFLISVIVAVPMGILSARRQNSWVDYLFRGVSIAGLALPSFWVATLVILLLSKLFHWTPPLGYVTFAKNPWVNIQQLFWPAAVIGFTNLAVLTRMTRSTLLEVMREDYVRTAWAKGLPPRTVLTVHALRNAVPPILTLAGMELGNLLSGAIVIEIVFTLPGVGRYLIDAIFHRDYPAVQAIVLMMGATFVILNLIVDLLYGVFDPRIRYE